VFDTVGNATIEVGFAILVVYCVIVALSMPNPVPVPSPPQLVPILRLPTEDDLRGEDGD